MPKSYAKLTNDLVIVESPAKCKKIEGYLGPGYKCIASFGHLRELASLENVFERDFDVLYTPIEEPLKKRQIRLIGSEIAATVASGGEVILATDDDREGEAIAWHICGLFNLNPERTKRIIFHEITEKAIQEAIKTPTKINMDLVRAQQARQILDLIVGFKVSPVLWKHITAGSLSAGRCQTPALKLVYDNYKEIQRSPGCMQYHTTGYFTPLCIPFDLNVHHTVGTDEMTDFLFESAEFGHILQCEPVKKTLKAPPQPLNTSRIQQAASNELHFSPKDTMRLCQSLYEGGYITYMRTDSRTVSAEFLQEATKYIGKTWTPDHVGKTDTLPLKKKDDTDPHEAIRPTKVYLTELPEKDADPKEKRLYHLIWQTTVESCMTPASFFSIKAEISSPSPLPKQKYTYTSEMQDFSGWMAVENKKPDETRVKIYNYLSSLKQKPTPVGFSKISSTVRMKELKQHYTEARLVQLLEEQGIGRPSTFSSLVEKIQERGYVKKRDIKGREVDCVDYELENGDVSEIVVKREFGNEKGKLVVEPLGIVVTEFLEKHFASLFQYDYTRTMEDALDKISSGLGSGTDWKDLCRSCLDQVNHLISETEKTTENKKMEYKIDAEHSYIIGKHGPVIKCVVGKKVSFKGLRKDIEIDMARLANGGYTLSELLEDGGSGVGGYVKKEEKEEKEEKEKKEGGNTNNKKWEYQGLPLSVKKGKFGLYAAWGKNTKSLRPLGNRPIENITYEEVVGLL